MRRSGSAGLAVLFCASTAAAQDLPFEHCGLEPPAVARRAGAVPRKRGELASMTRLPLVRRVRLAVVGNQATGALTGRTVYVSAGHGWVWTGSAWSTQRPNTNGIVEDLVAAEAVDQYVLTYLRNMGAHVVPVREADVTAELVIVDDEAAAIEGEAAAEVSTEPGWGEVALPIASDDVNPFEAGGTRFFTTSASETGRAVWSLGIPSSGEYNVYVSYAQGANRASDAHYRVRHAGGESSFRVDQRRHGSTWVLLGRFWFEAGALPERASVVLSNDSADAASGAVVSLDAVRVGGGVGAMDRGGGANGRPMYENCARYYAQLSGAPRSVFDYASTEGNDDVGTRSRFAAWDHESGEDAVYVSWHSNAPNPGRGTESYTYGPDPPPGDLGRFSGVDGSVELQAAVHGEIIGDLRAAWDADWPDRGRFTAYFGELNPDHNPEMPAVLVEVAFHDTPEDADSLRSPGFRRIVARSIAQGVARYFATRDGAALTLPPEPPTAVRVENEAAGALRVSWRPPEPDAAGGDEADGYRVYVSSDGRAFDDGAPTLEETLLIADLAPGAVRYVRVAATNAGGESLPSEVVGARVSGSGEGSVLVVGGFDRLDGAMLPVEDLSAWDLGTVDRMWLDRMNDGTYAARHGAAAGGAGYSFDGATDEAITLGDVDLARYQAVDWFVGEDSIGDEPFTAAARASVTGYLDSGGHIFVTGSELGWAMDYGGTPEEQAFYRETLRTLYQTDDSETYSVRALSGPYDGMADFSFDDPARGSYDPEWPDTLAAGAESSAALEYSGGTGGIAAVAWSGGVVFGFPFETILGADVRQEVMARTLEHLGVVEPEPVEPGLDGGPGRDAGDEPDAGAGADGGEEYGGAEGCSCHAAPSGRRGAWALCLALLLALGRLGRSVRRRARSRSAPTTRASAGAGSSCRARPPSRSSAGRLRSS